MFKAGQEKRSRKGKIKRGFQKKFRGGTQKLEPIPSMSSMYL